MHESPSMPPATSDPYTGCPHCTAYREHEDSLLRLRPLPSDGVLAVDPDAINWNDCYRGYEYWGSNWSERRMIVRPLPRSITDRTPLELFEHILDFLRWETRDLYNCALVCSAWHRYSQRVLYSRVVLASRVEYDAVAQSHLQNGRSRTYLTGTNALVVYGHDNTPPGPRGYFAAVPLVLGRSMCSLTCLQFDYSIGGPYHPSFIRSFSEFSALVHLTLQHFKLHSFFDLRSIICGLKTLRELDLDHGSLVSRAPPPPSGFPPVNAPHLSKVTLRNLDNILFSQLSQWVTSTEICHGCRSLRLWPNHANESPEQRRCGESIVRKLGPSLDTLVYSLQPHDWPDLSFLACCTRLSTLQLLVKANPIDSWQGLVSGLHEMLSHCSSPIMHTLQVVICMLAPEGSPSTSTHPDSEFWTIDLTPIHDIMKQPLFDSLQDASIQLSNDYHSTRLTCDTVLMAEEMERRLRLILEPWDKRGILAVRGYNEPTDEELRRRKAEDARNAEEGDPSAGAGEEAQSSPDESVLASDQEHEDGREGAV